MHVIPFHIIDIGQESLLHKPCHGLPQSRLVKPLEQVVVMVAPPAQRLE
jgi:hypothetical protein